MLRIQIINAFVTNSFKKVLKKQFAFFIVKLSNGVHCPKQTTNQQFIIVKKRLIENFKNKCLILTNKRVLVIGNIVHIFFSYRNYSDFGFQTKSINLVKHSANHPKIIIFPTLNARNTSPLSTSVALAFIIVSSKSFYEKIMIAHLKLLYSHFSGSKIILITQTSTKCETNFKCGIY